MKWSSSFSSVVCLGCMPQGPAAWKWVFVLAAPLVYVVWSTAGDREVSEDTDQELQDLVRLEVQWALPLVVLALSRPEKALQWLLFHLLRYTFCGICGNELEGLALMLEDKNHFFLTGWLSTTSFAITYTSVVTLRRDISVVVHPWVTHRFYCSQDCTQECAQAEGRWMLLLVVLAWETFQKTTLLHSGQHQRRIRNQTKVLVVRN